MSWSRIECTTSVATPIADSHSLPLLRRKARKLVPFCAEIMGFSRGLVSTEILILHAITSDTSNFRVLQDNHSLSLPHYSPPTSCTHLAEVERLPVVHGGYEYEGWIAFDPSAPPRPVVLVFPNYAGLKQFDIDQAVCVNNPKSSLSFLLSTIHFISSCNFIKSEYWRCK